MGYKNFYQGRLQLKNPKKYIGNPNNVIYRSSYEAEVYKTFDKEPNIIAWGAEELSIPYIDPNDLQKHRYFPDCIIKVNTKNGIKTFMIEIKPYVFTQPPKEKKRKTKNFINEVKQYAKNTAKWEAAEKFCEENGWKFLILTEGEIFSKLK